MLWLLILGNEAIGVEFSQLAVEAFFTENSLSTTTTTLQDKFSLTGVGAVYDRASLVALPPEMRAAYAEHMQSLFQSGTKTLLVAFNYPQHEMQGPPFSVNAQEVQAL